MLITDYLIEIFNKYKIKYKKYSDNIIFIEDLIDERENCFLYSESYGQFYCIDPHRSSNSSYNYVTNTVKNKSNNIDDESLRQLSHQAILYNKANVFIKKLPITVLCYYRIIKGKIESSVAIGTNIGEIEDLCITSSFEDETLYWLIHDFMYLEDKQNHLQFLDYIQDNYPESDIGEILC